VNGGDLCRGLLNALRISGKKIEACRSFEGAGAAGIACLSFLKAMGAKP